MTALETTLVASDISNPDAIDRATATPQASNRTVAARPGIRSGEAAEPRHFLDIDRVDADSLRGILDTSADLKRAPDAAGRALPLAGRILAMIFESPSTRTRVSFEVAMKQLGGDVVSLGHGDSQLGRGESIADTARVLSRYVDAIMLRTKTEQNLLDLAAHATVPVINGLTDRSHPCQIMADILTFEEHRGSIAGKVIAWSGDGNNVATSWIHAAARFGFTLRIGCPEHLAPPASVLGWAADAGADVVVTHDPDTAVTGADCVVTDTWVSMHADAGDRQNHLAPFRVDERLLGLARPDALFMHCLPAYRDKEVTAAVIDGDQSVVWDEAENRLHVQKGILSWCLG